MGMNNKKLSKFIYAKYVALFFMLEQQPLNMKCILVFSDKHILDGLFATDEAKDSRVFMFDWAK